MFNALFINVAAFMAVLLTEGAQIGADTIMSILEAITAQFSIANIVAFIAGILGVSIAFVFLWWGIRKGTKAIMAAVRNGKFKI